MLSIAMFVCETPADHASAAADLLSLAHLAEVTTLVTIAASGAHLICALSRTTATPSPSNATATELAELLTTGLDLLTASESSESRH